jgi:hypothetical protein
MDTSREALERLCPANAVRAALEIIDHVGWKQGHRVIGQVAYEIPAGDLRHVRGVAGSRASEQPRGVCPPPGPRGFGIQHAGDRRPEGMTRHQHSIAALELPLHRRRHGYRGIDKRREALARRRPKRFHAGPRDVVKPRDVAAGSLEGEQQPDAGSQPEDRRRERFGGRDDAGRIGAKD